MGSLPCLFANIQRETTYMTSCLLSWPVKHLGKRVKSYRKEFGLRGATKEEQLLKEVPLRIDSLRREAE